MSDRDRPLYAVLIDADNIPAKHADAILKEVTSFGEPALRRVYGDWSHQQLSGWTTVARELGLVQYQQTANTRGKNSSDIGLVIDAMDILHEERFDGFVLVSSDSDFTRLASRIREQGLDVIGIGAAKTPQSLKNVCNRFITLENIIDDPVAPAGKSEGKSGRQPVTQAIPIILDAIDKIASDDEWYALAQIAQHVQREHPDFDTRSYGKRKWSELIADLKRFEAKKIGNQLHVRRVD